MTCRITRKIKATMCCGSDQNQKGQMTMTCDQAPPANEPNETGRVLTMLEGMALDAERDAVAQVREKAAEQAAAAHDIDVAAFVFDCSVWGSFLRLSWRRGAPADTYDRLVAGPQDFSTALYLPNIKSVTLTQGHSPDSKGIVGYRYNVDGGSSNRDYYGRIILCFDSKFVVEPIFPDAINCRGMFFEDATRSRAAQNQFAPSMGNQYDFRQLNYQTTDFPRMAADDKIEFTSLGATLFMPGGTGVPFYEAILLATGKDLAPRAEHEALAKDREGAI